MILTVLILVNIKEKKNGKNSRFFSNPLNKITVLALDCDRYRGDLESLSYHNELRVLYINQRAAGWLVKPFYEELNIMRYVNAKNGSNDAISHKKAYDFMYKFLRIFYKYISIDCVTTVNYRYVEDYNWAKASDRLGVPFIMLYRECLLACNRLYDYVVSRQKTFGSFHGSHIIVQNNTCKQAFIDSDFAPANKITAAGAIRMDSFIDKINKQKNKKKYSKKTFILFYFPYTANLFGKEQPVSELTYKYQYYCKNWEHRKELFSDLHNAIIELAIEYPEIDFIIKPKQEMVENVSWGFYEEVVRKSKVNIKKLFNYRVDLSLNVSDAIINTDIVCALQSSTVIESAIAGKRVILPLFYDYLNSLHSNDFLWKNNIDLFDVATDKDKFKKTFKSIIKNNEIEIPKNIQEERVKLFEKWLFTTNRNSLDMYYKTIKRVVQSHVKKL